jgi:hypothetical protein
MAARRFIHGRDRRRPVRPLPGGPLTTFDKRRPWQAWEEDVGKKEAFVLMGGELWWRVRSFAVLAVVGAVAYVILKLLRAS